MLAEIQTNIDNIFYISQISGKIIKNTKNI